MRLSNLPPGVTDRDIEEQAGALTDDLVTRLLNLVTDGEWCSPLAQEAAARIRELEGERDALRAMLLKSYCYVAAHVPIGVKTDNDRKVLMLDIDAALKETP